MKSFKELLERAMGILLFTHDNIDFKFSQNGEHTLENRLKRANITKKQFYKDLKKNSDKLTKQGIYLFTSDSYKFLARYSITNNKKELYIFTILNQNMVAKDYDYNMIIEWLETCGIEINHNEVHLLEDYDLDILIENKQVYIVRGEIFEIEIN